MTGPGTPSTRRRTPHDRQGLTYYVRDRRDPPGRNRGSIPPPGRPVWKSWPDLALGKYLARRWARGG